MRVDGHPSAGPKAHTLQHNPLGGHIGAIAKGDAKLQRALRGEFLLACAGVYHMALRGQTKQVSPLKSLFRLSAFARKDIV